MTTIDALKIVYQLAEGNVLTEENVIEDEEILRPMKEEQEKALEVINNLIFGIETKFDV